MQRIPQQPITTGMLRTAQYGTKALSSEPDALVLGGGLAGTAIAAYFVQQGLHTSVLHAPRTYPASQPWGMVRQALQPPIKQQSMQNPVTSLLATCHRFGIPPEAVGFNHAPLLIMQDAKTPPSHAWLTAQASGCTLHNASMLHRQFHMAPDNGMQGLELDYHQNAFFDINAFITAMHAKLPEKYPDHMHFQESKIIKIERDHDGQIRAIHTEENAIAKTIVPTSKQRIVICLGPHGAHHMDLPPHALLTLPFAIYQGVTTPADYAGYWGSDSACFFLSDNRCKLTAGLKSIYALKKNCLQAHNTPYFARTFLEAHQHITFSLGNLDTACATLLSNAKRDAERLHPGLFDDATCIEKGQCDVDMTPNAIPYIGFPNQGGPRQGLDLTLCLLSGSGSPVFSHHFLYLIHQSLRQRRLVDALTPFHQGHTLQHALFPPPEMQAGISAAQRTTHPHA